MRSILLVLLLAATSSAEVSLTVLTPIQEDYGTAQVYVPADPAYDGTILDAPTSFTVGNTWDGVRHLGWVRWDLSALRPDAEILGVAVVLDQSFSGYCIEATGLGIVAPSVRLEPPFDVPEIRDDLLTGPVYGSTLVGDAAGERTVVLGAEAISDVQAARAAGEPFQAGLRVVDPVGRCAVFINGRSSGRPALHVVWNAPVPTEHNRWGAVKSLYRP